MGLLRVELLLLRRELLAEALRSFEVDATFLRHSLEVVLALDDRARAVGAADEVDHRVAVGLLVEQQRALLRVGFGCVELDLRRQDLEREPERFETETVDLGLRGREQRLGGDDLCLEVAELRVEPCSLRLEVARRGPCLLRAPAGLLDLLRELALLGGLLRDGGARHRHGDQRHEREEGEAPAHRRRW